MFIINFIFLASSRDAILILIMLIEGGGNIYTELSKMLFIQRHCQMYKALFYKMA